MQGHTAVLSRIAVFLCIVFCAWNADGLTLERGSEEDRHLHEEILKEALLRETQFRVNQEMRQEQLLDSREGGLLANPCRLMQSACAKKCWKNDVVCAAAYDEGPLSYLRSETIRDLMVEGVAVQHGFVGEAMRRQCLKELELLDFDGRFNEVFQQSVLDVRKDFMCWMALSDLDRENQQVGWVVQMSVFPPASFYRMHSDGGFSQERNNGRKITAIYYPNAKDWQDADGGVLRVFKRRTRKEQQTDSSCLTPSPDETPIQEIKPQGDALVLLRFVVRLPACRVLLSLSSLCIQLPVRLEAPEQKAIFLSSPPCVSAASRILHAPRVALLLCERRRSREIPHEVSETLKKRFAISFYMTGPPGPGDD
ncbi:hypoxia- inducible factor prolyl hydroxylase [Cyclospora cayetanensis]|uniref:Hypoxia-inducible factor prolyl hydroxylase n=1 Tax=Cyclospora cayetanensis TaxID=88456 RepID=A0A1D3D224_9EIME|nr:hypoxia- inducible factor prolyl hydroxylase [Cyclospora cayetanensis]